MPGYSSYINSIQKPFDSVSALLAVRNSFSQAPQGPTAIEENLGAMPTPGINSGGYTGQIGGNAGMGDWKATLTPAEKWILQKESGLNPTAKNPKSSAYGIWQGLESTRKQYMGANWQSPDPVHQLPAFRAYVKARYGTPEAAVSFHRKNGWY